MKKTISMIAVFIMVFCLFPKTVHAASAGVVINGDFSDWSNVPKTVLSNHPYYDSVALIYDDTYIYMYVQEKTSQAWDTWYPDITIQVDGTGKTFRINRTDYSGSDGTFALSVANDWNGAINNASGFVTRSGGFNTWEIKIPIQSVFTANGDDGNADNAVSRDVSNIVANINNGGNISLTAIDFGNEAEVPSEPEEEPEKEPETPDETEEEEVPTQPGSSARPLAIDGYFDDWDSVPKTLITYGSHNSDGSINEYHNAAMVVRDGYVYVYVRMSDLYQSQIPVDELHLAINGQDKAFIIRGRDDQNYIDWSRDVYHLANGINNGLGIFYRDGGNLALGEAAVTISGGNPNDTFEFRMSISELEKLYGLEEGTIGNGAKLEFYSPNIGPDRVTVVGTSTGTYLGIGLCVVSVLAAAWYNRKRKQALS